MDITFPFENVGESYFGKIYRPVAKVLLKSIKNNIWTDAWMVVDTGADFTILPNYLAHDLEISIKQDCVKDTTFGVGGERSIYLCKHKVDAEVGALKRKIPLAFFDTNEVPALMGRLGFIETFETTFLKKHVVRFTD